VARHKRTSASIASSCPCPYSSSRVVVGGLVSADAVGAAGTLCDDPREGPLAVVSVLLAIEDGGGRQVVGRGCATNQLKRVSVGWSQEDCGLT
jgi:hypothetical protein